MEKEEFARKNVMEKYGEGGALQSWDKMAEMVNPQYAKKFYELMAGERFIPDDLNGFVFLSPSSNKASKEIKLAEIFDKRLEGTSLKQKPIFIASDIFGTHEKDGRFLPGFDPEKKPQFKNIDFTFVTSEAGRLPIRAESVTMIMDRMGAMWHAIDDGLASSSAAAGEAGRKTDAEKILKEYAEKLKKGGVILFDAFRGKGLESTGQLLFRTFGKKLKDIEELGFSWKLVGKDEMCFLALQKRTDAESEK
ncbi:MAG: hypothetical protein A3A28_05370 [Candidatus Sungbacteria bacterium RIFCSPLOWO2_01_FULL_47_32]|uniref:Uncharacterized protein n=1 Tax=Candidatus Sungbacteria bacterium RIFCSPHIGHO2_01_FULL_47_32 TaxID=1802264 RepID=A0A1G2K3A9_9BACT|nr:MAG: hypothetical protein UX72_C0001G0149 [Parcubacteria group bacterium GW2011_GWA2_47_10]OGZ93904.1 MAG: hypothetical protein A2633_05310 [Candidatus Sungbacteria bacterium RIFCSPHIGHO2_01_FULL_47_32]OGZ99156.1 MAG: hypothetical protein A3D57_05360 [Candidatus Sungbacteria bacterium RIFCSPHIGHO2_02_FULL_46_12]OHA06032.1 MAG: hypothetical protein A3A28_05370 [Candidatus Sungbacteria bacterium RIFCSPLOWO2_01_FULL_47_32]